MSTFVASLGLIFSLDSVKFSLMYKIAMILHSHLAGSLLYCLNNASRNSRNSGSFFIAQKKEAKMSETLTTYHSNQPLSLERSSENLERLQAAVLKSALVQLAGLFTATTTSQKLGHKYKCAGQASRAQ
jgi:hypothetical protein